MDNKYTDGDGGLGGAFLPRIVGELIDRYPISVTLWSLVLCAFILVSLMAVIFYFRKKAIPTIHDSLERSLFGN